MSEKIAVIGLGYVGLPLAMSLSKHFEVIGYDKNADRISQLKDGIDTTREIEPQRLKESNVVFTDNDEDLIQSTAYIIAVPTPIDSKKRPDLTLMIRATEMIGKHISPGDLVIYESTVYPGVTEETCGPILAEISGLKLYEDIKLGYSPERINPGDKERTIEKIVKVVAGQDHETLDRVDNIYNRIITAGTHRAPTIKVAEAAKVIENTQRDLNIALMNELAIIFDKLDIRTNDVLEAASTKWNFLPFKPGLVGGHCIGVDPYYLTSKAEEVGYSPHVILAGRRINDSMGEFVAQKAVKLMVKSKINLTAAKIGVYGITFKENVPDIRNSKVPDIVCALGEFGVSALIYDPLADRIEVKEEYGLDLSTKDAFRDLDFLIIAVGHDDLHLADKDLIDSLECPIVDLKSSLGTNRSCWSL